MSTKPLLVLLIRSPISCRVDVYSLLLILLTACLSLMLMSTRLLLILLTSSPISCRVDVYEAVNEFVDTVMHLLVVKLMSTRLLLILLTSRLPVAGLVSTRLLLILLTARLPVARLVSTRLLLILLIRSPIDCGLAYRRERDGFAKTHRGQ